MGVGERRVGIHPAAAEDLIDRLALKARYLAELRGSLGGLLAEAERDTRGLRRIQQVEVWCADAREQLRWALGVVHNFEAGACGPSVPHPGGLRQVILPFAGISEARRQERGPSRGSPPGRLPPATAPA